VDVPERLAWLRGSARGTAWLDRLPDLLAGCARSWHLDLARPYPDSFTSLVLPAVRDGGQPVVLKVQFPDRETEHEAAALQAWNGNGAVRLLEHDPSRKALLLERCEPGTPLSDVEPDAALDVAIGLLPRVWIPAGAPFRPLADEARWWAGSLPGHWERAGRPFERELLDAALDAMTELPRSQGPQVLVHQDLHAGNVLRAEREPWLVIDPKPLAGEREFGVAALIRGGELGDGRDALQHRLDLLTGKLGLNRDRARRWALAQTLAWAFDDDEVSPDQVECARWLLEAD
jgi:streptomycin 6-kinase